MRIDVGQKNSQDVENSESQLKKGPANPGNGALVSATDPKQVVGFGHFSRFSLPPHTDLARSPESKQCAPGLEYHGGGLGERSRCEGSRGGSLIRKVRGHSSGTALADFFRSPAVWSWTLELLGFCGGEAGDCPHHQSKAPIGGKLT